MSIPFISGAVYKKKDWRYIDPETNREVQVKGGLYILNFKATALHAMNEVIVYTGLDGKDKDKHYTCSLSDFDLKFEVPGVQEAPETPSTVNKILQETKAEPPPAKVAGYISKSPHG